MAGGVVLANSGDVTRVEAPVTVKGMFPNDRFVLLYILSSVLCADHQIAYFMCAFAAFGGIFFGYDSGYISGVMGMKAFYQLIEGPDATALNATNKSLITSILSAGTL